MKHFICRECGNLVAAVNYTGAPLSCCHRTMEELVPKPDASREKHTPRITQVGERVTVSVGTEASLHPQSEEHRVDWVVLVTDRGSQRKMLRPSGRPEASFVLTDGERVLKAFAYCNLHGLWVTEAEQKV